MPPWQVPWPLIISSRTIIDSCARPGSMSTTTMSSAWEQRSSWCIALLQACASAWLSGSRLKVLSLNIHSGVKRIQLVGNIHKYRITSTVAHISKARVHPHCCEPTLHALQKRSSLFVITLHGLTSGRLGLTQVTTSNLRFGTQRPGSGDQINGAAHRAIRYVRQV